MNTLWNSISYPHMLLRCFPILVECHSTILHDNMYNSHLMVDARRVEEAKAKRNSKYAKIEGSYDLVSFKNRL